MKKTPQVSFSKHFYDDQFPLTLESCRTIEGKLKEEIKILEKHLEDKNFGVGPETIGSELELALVDNNSLMPAMINTELCDYIKHNNDPISIQPELSKFSLEYNGPVVMANQQPLNTLANELELTLTRLKEYCARNFAASVIPIGIIPTLELDHINYSSITSLWRYQAIDGIMKSLRNDQNFNVNISGIETLNLQWPNTVICGVNNSYQIHLRVNPQDFNEHYNAAQIASAFALSISGNSPLLLGHKLWDETRIAILEQGVNNKTVHVGSLQDANRVSFGRGWIKDGPVGLLKEACELFYPILPMVDVDNNQSKSNGKKGPAIGNIVQHNSTIWPWNRGIYDPTSEGHFRIEMRCLPSGPTIQDMVMNAGFLLGLTKGLSYEVNNIIDNLAFKYASYNFYQAAEFGLNAQFIWPNKNGVLAEIPVTKLLDRMLDLSAFGLQQLGASQQEIIMMQKCIRARYKNNMTGAIWQRHVFDSLVQKEKLSKQQALKEMFRLYIQNQESNLPVAMWTY